MTVLRPLLLLAVLATIAAACQQQAPSPVTPEEAMERDMKHEAL